MNLPDDSNRSTIPAIACSGAEQLDGHDETSYPSFSSGPSRTAWLDRWLWRPINLLLSVAVFVGFVEYLVEEDKAISKCYDPATRASMIARMAISALLCASCFWAGINAALTIRRQQARRSTVFVALLNLPLFGICLFGVVISIDVALTDGNYLGSAVTFCFCMTLLGNSVANVGRNRTLRGVAEPVPLTSGAETEPTPSQPEDRPMEQETSKEPKEDVKPESRSTAEKGRLSWAIIGGSTIFVVGALAFAFLVWPTVYRYDSMSLGPSTRLPVRINRLTGKTEILYRSGWTEVAGDSPRSKGVVLPEDQLWKLTGTAGISMNYFDGNIYNGSDYLIQEITVAIAVTNSSGTVVPSRLYRMPYTSHGDKPLEPLQSGSFRHDVGFTLAVDQKLSWDITEAKGQLNINAD